MRSLDCSSFGKRISVNEGSPYRDIEVVSGLISTPRTFMLCRVKG